MMGGGVLGSSGVMLRFYFLPFRPDLLSITEVEIWDTCPIHTHRKADAAGLSGKGL